ncbi:hypothetical protein BEL05_10640 [Shewanella colwelliana]|uniref:Anti-bacteriophage protein A/HamA C-terminal domain-containing protein n=1 Tax=Shewanella colwelliana TaxID=23 RepID=A0A1E5IQZ7_SHECO|nr:hypothetical protein BEL05_10640 [Shewanella colwelliana]
MDGVFFKLDGENAICHVEYISAELKGLIKKNLSTICHGSHIHDYFDDPLYSYQTTLESFLERYDSKTQETQIGMIGELLSHLLLTELYDDFEIASAFFNLEENSIKKGFDLVLCRTSDKSLWITEVKSGMLHKGRGHDKTTRDLLNSAKQDLNKRLNETEKKYWYNSINSVRSSLHDESDYKQTLLKILRSEGNNAVEAKATSKDNSVVLITNLFDSMQTKITLSPVVNFTAKLNKAALFYKVFVFCIQKETYSNVVEFIRSEAVAV